MSAVPQGARNAPEQGPAKPSATASVARIVPVRGGRLVSRLVGRWSDRIAWALGRTGRPGTLGLLLLLAAGVFLLSTHLPVAAEVKRLRGEVAAAEQASRIMEPLARPAEETARPRALPARGEMPAILRQIFAHATEAKLALDSGKYEVSATAGSSVLRHQVLLPVSGPYASVRAFIDATLRSIPAVAVRDLTLERKIIGDTNVEARIRLTVYTSPTAPEPPAQPESGKPDPAGRVTVSPDVKKLFALHSWHVIPVVPLPPPPPPPAPTAPPFPYSFLGSYAPDGAQRVFFLAKGEHVVDVHLGDRLDGVYLFESAEGGQLVFVYLPLDIRQTLAAGAPR